MSNHVTKKSIIEKTYFPENLPPAFAEAASRRQVTPLCPPGQRPKRGIPPFCKGRGGGIWSPVSIQLWTD